MIFFTDWDCKNDSSTIFHHQKWEKICFGTSIRIESRSSFQRVKAMVFHRHAGPSQLVDTTSNVPRIMKEIRKHLVPLFLYFFWGGGTQGSERTKGEILLLLLLEKDIQDVGHSIFLVIFFLEKYD